MKGSPEQYRYCDEEIWLQMLEDEESERERVAELYEDDPFGEHGEI